jgi:hypothetical protein
MVAIAPAEIAVERDSYIGMAGVVGGVDHEFAQGSKVTLNAIEMTGRGGRRNQFDVVQRRPLADQRRPVQREVVVDQVDAQVIGIAAADGLIERQHLGRALGQPIAAEQHVRVHVVGAKK